MPFERPLYEPPAAAAVESLIPPATDEHLEADLLFAQTFINTARLDGDIRSVLPELSSALLADIIEMYPIEQGAAEIIGYLALSDDLTIEMDEPTRLPSTTPIPPVPATSSGPGCRR